MTGIINLQKESFRALAGVAFTVVLQSYMIVLTAIIDEFKIASANEKIKDKMTLAKMLPFTNGPTEELALSGLCWGRPDPLRNPARLERSACRKKCRPFHHRRGVKW